MEDSDNVTWSTMDDSTNTTFGDFDPYVTLTYLPDGLFFHPHWKKYREMLENVPDSVHYVLGIYMTFVGCAGIIGNAFVIYIFLSTKSLRTPSNLFIVNLAVSDLAFSAVNGFPLMTISCFMRKWYFGRLACILYGALSGVFGLTSINTLALIAFDRFYVIQFPLRAIRTVTHMRSILQIILVWIWATVWSFPPVFGWGRFIPEGLQTSCGFDFLSLDPWNQAYNFCLFSCGFLLPVCLATGSYIGIVCAVSSQAKHMVKIKKTSGSVMEDRERKQEIQIAKIAAVTISLFVATWLPYASLAMISTAGHRWIMTPYVCQIPSVFAKASAIWNPFIYSVSHPKYRLALQQRFPWLICRKPGGGSSVENRAKPPRRQSMQSEKETISSDSDAPEENESHSTPVVNRDGPIQEKFVFTLEEPGWVTSSIHTSNVHTTGYSLEEPGYLTTEVQNKHRHSLHGLRKLDFNTTKSDSTGEIILTLIRNITTDSGEPCLLEATSLPVHQIRDNDLPEKLQKMSGNELKYKYNYSGHGKRNDYKVCNMCGNEENKSTTYGSETQTDTLLLNPTTYIIKSEDCEKADYVYRESSNMKERSHNETEAPVIGNRLVINDEILSKKVMQAKATSAGLKRDDASHMAGPIATRLVYLPVKSQEELIESTLMNKPGITFSGEDHLSDCIIQGSDDMTGTTFIGDEHDGSILSAEEYDTNGTASLSSVMEGTISSLEDHETVSCHSYLKINFMEDDLQKATCLSADDTVTQERSLTQPQEISKVMKASITKGNPKHIWKIKNETTTNMGCNSSAAAITEIYEYDAHADKISGVGESNPSPVEGNGPGHPSHVTRQAFSLRVTGATGSNDNTFITADSDSAAAKHISYDEGCV